MNGLGNELAKVVANRVVRDLLIVLTAGIVIGVVISEVLR